MEKKWRASLFVVWLLLAGISLMPAQEAFREFKSSDKSKTITAKVVSVDMAYGTVTLVKEDGNTMTVAVTHFSKEDITYLKEYARSKDGKLDLDPNLHADLAPVVARHKAATKESEKKLAFQQAEAAKKYLEVIGLHDAKASLDGQVELATFLQAEKKKVEGQEVLPEKALMRLPSPISVARRAYLGEISEAKKAFDEAQAKLGSHYLASLGKVGQRAEDVELIKQVDQAKKDFLAVSEEQKAVAAGASPDRGPGLEGTSWKHVEGKFSVWKFAGGKINGNMTYEVRDRDELVVDFGNRKMVYKFSRDGKTLLVNGKADRIRVE